MNTPFLIPYLGHVATARALVHVGWLTSPQSLPVAFTSRAHCGSRHHDRRGSFTNLCRTVVLAMQRHPATCGGLLWHRVNRAALVVQQAAGGSTRCSHHAPGLSRGYGGTVTKRSHECHESVTALEVGRCWHDVATVRCDVATVRACRCSTGQGSTFTTYGLTLATSFLS